MGSTPDTTKVTVHSRPRQAPGPRGIPWLGSVLDLRQRGQIRFYLEHWRTYGDVIRFRLGPFVAHILAHPEHIHYVLASNAHNYGKGPSYAKASHVIGNGLLTSEGSVWRHQRRLLQPSFTHNAVLPLASEMSQAVEAMLARWQTVAAVGGGLAMNQEMARLALTIIASTIFSIDLGDTIHLILEAAAEATTFVNGRLVSFFDVPLVLPTPANHRFTKAIHQFDRVVYQLIETRRRQQRDTPDLLGRLLSARDEEIGRPMSERQIRDEVLTMLLAGHETSAVALTWIWYLLAQYPAVEHKLQAELATRLGGRTPTTEELTTLPYLRMIIEEAMRLYPPVWTFPRAALADDVIGGYHIPAGSLLFPSQFLTHRHPDFWVDPEQFDPERFAPERAENRVRYAYYPFGGGPRSCIGVHFALIEITLVLAMVVQRYRLRLDPGPPIAPKSIITLQPSRTIVMRVEAR